MKVLLGLCAAVVVIVLAWLILGRSSGSPGHGHGAAALEIPAKRDDPAALARASQQFLAWHPEPSSAFDALELLRVIHEHVSEEQWGPVVVGTFQGWRKLRQMPSVQAELAPLSPSLIGRFVRWGGPAEIDALFLMSKNKDASKALIDAAFLRESEREIGERGYAGSNLSLIVSAAIEQGEFDRAGDLLSRARFRTDVNDGGRRPAIELQQALGFYFNARGGKVEYPALLEFWVERESSLQVSRILETAGILLVKEGLYAWDAGKVAAVIGPSVGKKGSPEFWKASLTRHIGAPGDPRWTKSEDIATLARAIAWQFEEPDFESDLWARLADEEKGTAGPQVMWRLECVRRAALAASTDARREELAKRLAEGMAEARMPTEGLRMLAEIQKKAPDAKLGTAVDLLRRSEAQELAKQKELQALNDAHLKRQEEATRTGSGSAGIPAAVAGRKSNE